LSVARPASEAWVLPATAPRICTRCVIDAEVPGVWFDRVGVCNHCKLHDALNDLYPLTPAGNQALNRLVAAMKQQGKRSTYDCIVGVSGGRDSSYTLYMAKMLGLRPLAVHFNDGFGNPVAGENMKKAAERLKVDWRTVTSDWRESKDLRIACLRASVPNLNMATDIGIATALLGTATREGVRYVIIGHSFRTEGIAPLEWNYLDGRYLEEIHRRFGAVPLRRWRPRDPGFKLNLLHLSYYTLLKRIRTIPLLYYMPYTHASADLLLRRELDWVSPGEHYFDDLYQSLLAHIQRVKFGFDRRRFNYAALVRSGQLSREEASWKLTVANDLEDPKVIALCIKRLGLTPSEFDEILGLPPKSFNDYPNHLAWLRRLRHLIGVLSRFNLIPKATAFKYSGL